jgi:hypothetical protein
LIFEFKTQKNFKFEIKSLTCLCSFIFESDLLFELRDRLIPTCFSPFNKQADRKSLKPVGGSPKPMSCILQHPKNNTSASPNSLSPSLFLFSARPPVLEAISDSGHSLSRIGLASLVFNTI